MIKTESKTNATEYLYHYTTEVCLNKIIEDSLLKVSLYEWEQGDKHPSLWLSKDEVWEPTALKWFEDEFGQKSTITKEFQYELAGLGRITIECSPEIHSWTEYRNESKLSVKVLDALELIGIELGSHPSNWFCSFKDIPMRNWVKVEIWDGDKWILYLKNVVDNVPLLSYTLKDTPYALNGFVWN
jgi:hypothetical protein